MIESKAVQEENRREYETSFLTVPMSRKMAEEGWE